MTDGKERDEVFKRSAPLMFLILVFAIAAAYFIFINPVALQAGGEQTTTRTLRQATPEPAIVAAQIYSEGGKTQTGEKQTTTKPSEEVTTPQQKQTTETTTQPEETTEKTEEQGQAAELTKDAEYEQYANEIEGAAIQSQFYDYYYSQQENGGFDYEG
ncbi:hypothetical protein HZC09_01045 [Candidatus Micrarchaeota archaeon]|nr:hypothetical protein [Candidatus Micrarchaeota archaeon]